jgi:hypothetical protein
MDDARDSDPQEFVFDAWFGPLVAYWRDQGISEEILRQVNFVARQAKLDLDNDVTTVDGAARRIQAFIENQLVVGGDGAPPNNPPSQDEPQSEDKPNVQTIEEQIQARGWSPPPFIPPLPDIGPLRALVQSQTGVLYLLFS